MTGPPVKLAARDARCLDYLGEGKPEDASGNICVLPPTTKTGPTRQNSALRESFAGSELLVEMFVNQTAREGDDFNSNHAAHTPNRFNAMSGRPLRRSFR